MIICGGSLGTEVWGGGRVGSAGDGELIDCVIDFESFVLVDGASAVLVAFECSVDDVGERVVLPEVLGGDEVVRTPSVPVDYFVGDDGVGLAVGGREKAQTVDVEVIGHPTDAAVVVVPGLQQFLHAICGKDGPAALGLAAVGQRDGVVGEVRGRSPESSLRSVDDSVGADLVAGEVALADLSGGVVVVGGFPLALVAVVEDAKIIGVLDGGSVEGGHFRQSLAEVGENVIALVLVEPLLSDEFDDGAGEAEVEVDIVVVGAGLVGGGVEAVVVELAAFEEDLLDAGHFRPRLGVVGGGEEVGVVGVALEQRRLVAEDHLDGDVHAREEGVLDLEAEDAGQRLVERHLLLLGQLQDGH